MVTITDIAKALGVTPSTVSRALADSPRVKEETRLAVHRKAEEMGYRRNVVASNLRLGRSEIVGIIVPRINRAFFSSAISGAEAVLRAAGYSTIICQTNEDYEMEIRSLRSLGNNQVAGILMSHAISAPDGSHVKEAAGDIPLVQFDRVYSEIPGAKVISDNFDGAYKATMHLVAAGYKRIGTIAGFVGAGIFADRLAGYRKALEDSGIQYDESIVFPESIVRETGHAAALQALACGCDALYSAGDFSALGAVDALKEKGVRIPEDFGIVGTANEFFTSLMTPSLSSLEQHPFEMGEAAAQAFLEGSGDTTVIPMDLHVRESSNRIINTLCQK